MESMEDMKSSKKEPLASFDGPSILKKRKTAKKTTKKVQFKEKCHEIIIVENWKKFNVLEEEGPPVCSCNLL